jgi:putative FmdB family regulatory protein
MPIYEYRCSTCGHELEALQKLAEAPLTTCPACSREDLVKLVSAAGFQLKGSGWYATDFKSNGKPKPAANDGDSKSTDAKPTDAKGDSKPGESKSEASPAASCGGKCACH